MLSCHVGGPSFEWLTTPVNVLYSHASIQPNGPLLNSLSEPFNPSPSSRVNVLDRVKVLCSKHKNARPFPLRSSSSLHTHTPTCARTTVTNTTEHFDTSHHTTHHFIATVDFDKVKNSLHLRHNSHHKHHHHLHHRSNHGSPQQSRPAQGPAMEGQAPADASQACVLAI